MSPEFALFQAGYLTIKDMQELEFGGFQYLLHIPNKEVMLSLHDVLIQYLTDENQFVTTKNNLYRALKNADMEAVQKTITTLFAPIPYNNYVKNTISNFEGYYASVIYVYLASLGLDIIAEDVTSRGRIDLTVTLGENIFVLANTYQGQTPLCL